MESDLFIELLINDIQRREPEAVKFVVNPYTIRTVKTLLARNRYDIIMYSFGYKFLLQFNKICEEAECYEICAKIKEQIELHNLLVKHNIPTQI